MSESKNETTPETCGSPSVEGGKWLEVMVGLREKDNMCSKGSEYQVIVGLPRSFHTYRVARPYRFVGFHFRSYILEAGKGITSMCVMTKTGHGSV
jgi:hypothetical protein